MHEDAEFGRLDKIVSLLAAGAMAMLIPFAILLVGAPIALAVRLISDALVWVAGVVFGA